ncbi:MAG TPA: adenylate/guanylate cyclase domain-containing protein [Blastocatellia bacterium]|nr:adenylate/guanylate cyclase domain-containing protein [Blastocatellia bacterium]HMX27365.1 adenylate/guanylate cyclase domain-containing protein [Blastocatellia bacterium]HMY74022.1 adenylate/guanylate cyclase domain-containing protein [Blastocatellia bacterium]HMZ20859.1 adenylate/guanylate cyclase domain-containing protein [Blastocatellia bacterium]HNG30893.1 adenylate/guanylate cyclase domain-containing protein [Blastocatellia bacterium]
MPNLYVQTPGNKNFTFEVNKPEISIGRELKNDLILDDPRVSRMHAVIVKSEGGATLRDLGSGNGTFVNGHRIQPNVDFRLKNEDQVKLGSCSITYQEADPMRTQIPSESFREIVQKTPNDLLSVSALHSFSESQEVPSLVYRQELEKKERILRLFYDLSHKLSSVFSMEEIYDQVFEILISVTSASRCFIFRKNEQSEFEQVAARMRKEGDIGTPLPISQTIFARVASERVSVLLEDAQQSDASFASKSILYNQIQSVMAAPIVGPRGLLGIIYADRHEDPEPFSADDLDLLNAVAVHTGIALNTVITYEKLQKQAQARSSFERFLPRQVVDEILRSPDGIRLGGVRQKVTALFADVRNFTTLSESSTPEMIVNLLNRYFSMVSEIIFRHGGTLDKYIGDGLMAMFGAPYVTALDAIQAVRAAIEMQRAMVAFNERLKAENLPPISIGIGINTGPAIVGYIGSETRLDYTAIGDTINTAARLESISAPGQIVVSENTMQALDEGFLLKPLGTERLKGKNVTLKTAEVVWR